jgi:hypothetical protein
MLQEIWPVVTSLLALLWWVAPLLLNFLMWGTQVDPDGVASNASKWATWIRKLSRYMANRRVRQWGSGVALVLMFVGGMGFENWRRPRAAQEIVANCLDSDGWMSGLEAIKAFAPDGHDFYEAIPGLKTLKQESIKLGRSIYQTL